MSDPRLEAWELVARTLGLVLVGPEAPWPDERRLWPGSRMRGVLEGIELDVHFDPRDLPTSDALELGSTVIDARATPSPPALWFSVVDGALDRAGGDREELVPLWLSPAVLEQIHQAPDWSFSLVEGHVHAHRRAPEASAAALTAAIRAVLRLARRPFELHDEIEALRVALGGYREPYVTWDPEAHQPIVVEAEGAAVEIEHRFARFGNRWRADRALYTRVSCHRDAAGTHRFVIVDRRHAASFSARGLRLSLDGGPLDERYLTTAEDPEHFSEHLTPPVRALIARVLPDAIVVDADVGVWALGLKLTFAEIGPYIDLARALAPERPPSGEGPYR